MTSMFHLATSVTQEIEIEFPNLFGGLAINYYRGFQLFGMPIYWYGVIITVGVILAYLYAMHRTRDFGLNKDRVFDVVFVAIICGFLGARIYYCVFTTLDPDSGMVYDFVTTFTTIRDGGLAIYGGIIGGFLSGFIMCKIRKVNFFAMTDIASLGFLIGQTLGRWGNLINQEAHGSVCADDWVFGMTGTIISREVEAGQLVHPCFLYESTWCLLGFILLHFYSKKLRSYDGEITLLYIAWYGIGRAFIESLRTDSLMAGQFRVSQILGAASFVVAGALFVVFKILTEKKGIPLYVNSQACKELMAQDRLAEAKRIAKAQARKAARETAPSILAPEAEDIELNLPEGEREAQDEESPEQEQPAQAEQESTEENAQPEESVQTEENAQAEENAQTEDGEKTESNESEDEDGSKDN